MLGGAFVLAVCFGSALTIPIVVVVVVSVNFVVSVLRERATGMPVRRIGPQARTVANVIMASVVLGITFGAWALVSTTQLVWIGWIAAMLVAAGGVVYGPIEDRLLSEQLESGRESAAERESESQR